MRLHVKAAARSAVFSALRDLRALIGEPRGPEAVREDVPARGPQVPAEFDLPVPARERDAVLEVADVRLDPLARGHPDDQLGIGPPGAGRVHRGRERAADALRASDAQFLNYYADNYVEDLSGNG